MLNRLHIPFIILSIFIIRWIFIVGLGDWPDDYTFGYFQKIGLEIFKDFDVAYLNPINFTILNSILVISPFNDFFDINLVIWSLWTFNLFITIRLIKELDISLNKNSIYFIIFIFISLISPINSNFIFFNFFSNLLTTLILFMSIKYFKSMNYKYLVIISFFCALSIIVKVNVGLATSFIIFIFITILNYKRFYVTLSYIILLILNFILLCLITLDDNLVEILKIIFISPSLEKGGLFTLLIRSLPRISFTFQEFKYFKEILLMIFIFYPFMFYFSLRTLNFSNNKNLNEPIFLSNKISIVSSVIILALSFFSLFDILYFPKAYNFFLNLKLISLSEFNHHFLYSTLFILSLSTLLSIYLKYKKEIFNLSFYKKNLILIFLIIICFANLVALGAGGRYSVTYAISIYLVLFFYFYKKRIFNDTLFKYLFIVSVYYILSWNFFPNQLSTFTNYYKLPNSSNPDLYIPYGSNSFIQKTHIGNKKFFKILDDFIKNNIDKDKTFLWLNGGFVGFYDLNHYTPTLVPSSPPHSDENIKKFIYNIKNNKPFYLAFDTNKINWDWDNIKRYNGMDLKYDQFFLWIEKNYSKYKSVKIGEFHLSIFKLK